MEDRNQKNTEEKESYEGTTALILSRVQMGDVQAREQLFSLYMPILKRWAHGRLPGYARDVVETDDLVQITLLSAFKNIPQFAPRREGSFLAYLRQALLNSIRKEIRKATSVPGLDTFTAQFPDKGPSALDQAIGLEAISKYEQALSKLPEKQQEAIILRIEFGFSFREIAAALECTTSNAARMMVSRSLVKLVKEMK